MAVYINRSLSTAIRLVKLRDYLYMNASPDHAVKASAILAYLHSERIDINIKTLYKDIETLRDFFKLDIDYDKHNKGYILRNPPFESYELRMIVNSIQAAKFITQQEADRLTDKIMNELADNYTRPSLNRRTFIKNRVHAINKEAMQGLDTIYEAIATDKKISFKYFRYTLDNYCKSKEYQEVAGSKIITASPYWICWENDNFWVYVVHDGMEKLYLADADEDYSEFKIDEEGQEYVEFEETDETVGPMEEVEEFIYSGPLTFGFWELSHMEQIKILSDAREGKDIAQKNLGWANNLQEESDAVKIRLKVENIGFSDVIDRFGDKVDISPVDDKYFIATICEVLSLELYIWIRATLGGSAEILSPPNVEEMVQKYF